MKRFLAVSGAILRKDCWQVWPQAAPTALLVAVSNVSFELPVVEALLQVAALLVGVFLVVRLIQNDSAVSVQHDWLTRPIPWPALLVAKVSFAALWIGLPNVLGATLQGLRDGYSLAEALLEAVPESVPSPLLLVIVVVAVITANLWQALLVLVASCVLYLVVAVYTMFRSEILAWMDVVYASHSGTSWIFESALGFTVVVTCLLILWRQYGPRQTAQARALYGVGLLLLLLLPVLLLPPSRSWALQRQLGRGLGSAAQLTVELQPGCFAARLMQSSRDYATLGTPPGYVSTGDLTENAGRNPLVFSTVLTSREPAIDGLPARRTTDRPIPGRQRQHVVHGRCSARAATVGSHVRRTVGHHALLVVTTRALR